MAELKPYPEYKDSGIEWIGEIPEGWELLKIKYLVVLKSNTEIRESLPYIGLENIESKTGKILSINEERIESQSIKFLKDDILFGKLRPYLGKVAQVKFPGHCSTEFLVMTPKANEKRYLMYLMLSANFISKVNSSTYGAKMPRASWEFIGNIKVPRMENFDEGLIVNFLDQKTSQIDALIADKERLIALLEEKRQAVITETVTKGLDPNVNMKDSGIEWIGEIPENWSINKIKHVSTFVSSGKTPRGGGEVYVSHGIPFLRSMNVHFEGLRLEDVVYIDENVDCEMKATRVFPEDILLNITGASIGRTCIVPNSFRKGNVNQHVCIIRPSKKIIPIMLSKIMQSQVIQFQIYMSQNGSSREGLNFKQVKNLFFPLPDTAEEQKLLSDHIDKKSKQIIQTIKKVKNQISKLKEYRESLIYEAVTGKIDVRDYAAEKEEAY